jgi:DNA-binding GntR family transcriptional regulator
MSITLKPLREHLTKAERVYKSLVDSIVGNELAPGVRLIIQDIARQLSVSEIPVREALKRLESTGLIEVRPHQGAIVTRPSPEWIEELFVMRAGLEGTAMRTSFPLLTPENMREIQQMNLAMKARLVAGDYKEYSRLNREFHWAIIAKSPYPNLLNLIAELLMKSEFGRAIFGLKPTTMQTSDAEHDQLVEAIQQKDAEKAERINRQHRLRAGKELAEIVRQRSDEKSREPRKGGKGAADYRSKRLS